MPAATTIGHRRRMLGLDTAPASEFMHQHEFISLGCYCAPTFGLQLLDLRKKAYPFDWTRTSLDGIGRCLDAGFQNFLTYRGWCRTDQHPIFLDSEWGGSFWHHDLQNPRTQAVFNRRIERFLGLGDVPRDAPRVFVRLVNHTGELRTLVAVQQLSAHESRGKRQRLCRSFERRSQICNRLSASSACFHTNFLCQMNPDEPC